MGCVSTTPSEPAKEIGKLQQPGVPVQAPPAPTKIEKAEVSNDWKFVGSKFHEFVKSENANEMGSRFGSSE